MKAVILFMISISPAVACKLNLSEALKSGKVRAEFTSLGGHSDICVSLKLINNTSTSQQIEVEPGLILDSEADGQQNLIITSSELFTLKPAKSSTKNISAYCIQAHYSAPKLNSKFKLAGFADSGLVKLAKYINSQKITGSLAQQSFWVLSDRNALESINSGDTIQKSAMLDFLTSNFKLKKKGKYELFYKHDPEIPFTGKVVRVKGKINYELIKAGYNSLVIQDVNGKTYAIMYFKQYEKAGKHTRPFDFFTKGLAPGIYYARLYSNQKLLKEEPIEL